MPAAFSDLHTHLMGMGDGEFWFRIITKLVPKLEKATGRVVVHQTHIKKKNSDEFEPREYFIDNLRVLTQGDNKVFTSYNYRENEKSISKKGVIHDDLRKLVENDPDFANLLKKKFFFLDSKLEETNQQFKSDFQGDFTPEFYPNRFAMKDDIYEVFPIVLSVLLLYCIAKYHEQSVNYVEFSVSLKDLKNSKIRKYLEPDYLAAIIENNEKRKLKFKQKLNIDDKEWEEICVVHTSLEQFKVTSTDTLASIDLMTILPNFYYYFLAGVNRSSFQPNFSDTFEKIISYDEKAEVQRQGFKLEVPYDVVLDLLGVQNNRSPEKPKKGSFIGFDLLGDEFLNPWNPFFHNDNNFMVDLINEFYERTGNPLGLRIHAGENLSSKSKNNNNYKENHKSIIRNDLKRCYETARNLKDKVMMRIGHGVALKNKKDNENDEECCKRLEIESAGFIDNICFEWCPISNQILLSEYHRPHLIDLFLAGKLVVASDNDGILLSCSLKENMDHANTFLQQLIHGEKDFPTILQESMLANRFVKEL